MRIKRLIIVVATLALTLNVARAAHVWSDPSGWWDAHFVYDADAPRYTTQELSLDLFGSYINPEGKFNDLFDTSIRNGFWGGGVGLNYFLTREIGLAADYNISAKPEGNLSDHVVGSLVLRLPLGNSGVAPYLLGSGGRAFNDLYGNDLYHWVYGGGVGLEYRWSPTTGIFSDGRFLWSEEGTEYSRLLIRAGLRLVF
jgi:hypothetical protein